MDDRDRAVGAEADADPGDGAEQVAGGRTLGGTVEVHDELRRLAAEVAPPDGDGVRQGQPPAATVRTGRHRQRDIGEVRPADARLVGGR